MLELEKNLSARVRDSNLLRTNYYNNSRQFVNNKRPTSNKSLGRGAKPPRSKGKDAIKKTNFFDNLLVISNHTQNLNIHSENKISIDKTSLNRLSLPVTRLARSRGQIRSAPFGGDKKLLKFYKQIFEKYKLQRRQLRVLQSCSNSFINQRFVKQQIGDLLHEGAASNKSKICKPNGRFVGEGLGFKAPLSPPNPNPNPKSLNAKSDYQILPETVQSVLAASNKSFDLWAL